MTKEKQAETLKGAIKKWGKERQTDKAIEEMSELAKALLKYRHHKKDKLIKKNCLTNIMEEIADVEVLLMQLKSEEMFNCHYEVEEIKKYKINRLASILTGEL